MEFGNYEKKFHNFKRIVCVDNKSDFFSVSEEIQVNDIILTIDQDVVELCQEKSFPYVEIEKLFYPNELFDSYKLFTDLTLQIEKSIKISIQKVFNNGSDEVFEWFVFPLKILIDQIIFYKCTIEKSLSAFSVNKLVIQRDINLNFTDSFLVDANVSMLSLVAKDFAENNGVLIDQTYNHRNNKNNCEKSYFSFGQVSESILKYGSSKEHSTIGQKLNNFKSLINYTRCIFSVLPSKLNVFLNKKYFLSVGCREFDCISSSIESQGVRVVKLNSEHSVFINRKKADDLGKKIIDKDLIYENFNFKNYLIKFTGLVLINTNSLIYKRKIALKFFNYFKPSSIFVQTLSSFNLNAMVINSIAKELNIKVYCWMHGGYGGYSSISGYDVTDYRFTKNHIVYGEAVKDSINARESILKVIYPNVDFNVMILGSPFTKTFLPTKNELKKTKKKIVFTLPGVYGSNNYFFGKDRPHPYLNWWIELKQIIIALSKFEDNFDIVIKDYSYGPQQYRIKKILKKLRKNKILYISSEKNYLEVISDADILIYPWISTSFIEGLKTKADILIFDDSKMLSTTETILNNFPVFETSLDRFIISMNNYLNNYNKQKLAMDDLKIRDINTMKNYFIEPMKVNLVVNKLINNCIN
tara:strand:- start:5248 stop:7167 length:1920 start_codon:yes stop_codon:yes gene_type:complete